MPKLQRAFVWNGLKAAKLMDSIYLGMPIGVLTLWDTSRKNRNLLRVTTKVLPPYREHNQRVWFIVDGQQRLSVIHRALAGGVVQNGRNKQVDFDRVVFRVTDGDEVTRFQYRKPVEKTWVPVVDVLASNWRNRLNGLSNGQLNRALRCRKQLLGYKVPVIRVETEEIDEARELFLRINSAGTPLGAADRAFARASEFELREHAERAWEQLPSEFQGLTDEVLLQTRALIDHVDDVGADAMDKVAAEWDKRISADRRQLREFDKTWGRQQGATKRALDLLRSRFNVLGDGLLPSQYMVATLAVFFYHRPKQPAPDQMTQITRWFWGTAIGQRYSGRGYRQNILEDAKWFARLANGDNVAFKLGELVEPSELRRAGYGKRSSIADAFFCLLLGQKPQLLSNGMPTQTTDIAAHANRMHKHHIFPRQLLRSRAVAAVRLNSILNLCLLPAEENTGFGAKPPFRYLEPFASKRYFGRVMDRHLIPHDENSGLWDPDVVRGYGAFLREREHLVCSAFERAAGGIRLFRREQE